LKQGLWTVVHFNRYYLEDLAIGTFYISRLTLRLGLPLIGFFCRDDSDEKRAKKVQTNDGHQIPASEPNA